MKRILAFLLVALLLALPVLAGWQIEPNNVDEGGPGVAYTIGRAESAPVLGQFDTSKYTKITPAAGDMSFAWNDSADDAEAMAKGQTYEFYASYDAKNVYTLVIADAKNYFNECDDGDGNSWQFSCIQVSVATADAEGGERLEYGIWRKSNDGGLGAVVWAQGSEQGHGKVDFTPEAGKNYTVALKDGKLYYETIIPVNTFLNKDTVAEGEKIGWNIVIAQNTGKDEGHVHTQISSGCTGNGKNAQYFAKLTLGGAIAPPAPPPPAATGGSGSFVFIEAESGKNSGMQIADDAGAFNGKCIVSQDAEDTIEYTINIDNPGQYVIWARVYAEAASDNSYLYSFNGDTFNGTDMWIFDFYEMNEQPTPNDRFFDPKLQGDELYFTWYWLRMNYRDPSVDPAAWWNMQFFNMKAGANTLLLKTREIGAKIDKFIVTDDLDYDPKTISGDPEVPYLAKLAEEAAAAAAAEEAAREAEAAANQPAAPAEQPVEEKPATAPPTGDAGLVIFAALAAAAAFVVLKRKIAVK